MEMRADPQGGGPVNRISAPERSSALLLTCEDTERRQSSVRQDEGPHQTRKLDLGLLGLQLCGKYIYIMSISKVAGHFRRG